MTSALSFENATIRMGATGGGVLTVATGLSLDIADGTFVAIVGPAAAANPRC